MVLFVVWIIWWPWSWVIFNKNSNPSKIREAHKGDHKPSAHVTYLSNGSICIVNQLTPLAAWVTLKLLSAECYYQQTHLLPSKIRDQ